MAGNMWIRETGAAKGRDATSGMRDSVQSSGQLSTIQEPPPPYGSHEPADYSAVTRSLRSPHPTRLGQTAMGLTLNHMPADQETDRALTRYARLSRNRGG